MNIIIVVIVIAIIISVMIIIISIRISLVPGEFGGPTQAGSHFSGGEFAPVRKETSPCTC